MNKISDEDIGREQIATDEVNLSGKRTYIGRASGETLRAPKEQTQLRWTKLSGKRTEELCSTFYILYLCIILF